MADRKGICTNFGNCSRADNKEIISIPTGADLVCPEPGCGTQLNEVRENGGYVKKLLDRKWRIQIIVFFLVCVLVGVGIFVYRQFDHSGNTSADEKFLARLRTVLEECDRARSGISPDRMKELRTFAEGLKLTNSVEDLIRTGKENYLLDKRKALGPDVTSQKLQPLCDLANKLGANGVVQGCTARTEDVMALLVQGEYEKAKSLCSNADNDPQNKRLCAEIVMPLTVEASFQYQKAGEKVSPELPFDANDLTSLVLTNRDNYRFFVSVALDNTFLYVFQKDQHGVINRLFPDPVWTKGVDNPLQKSNVYRIPTGEKEWFYLDELPSTKTEPINETIYIVASPWRAKDLEELYGKIHESTSAEGRKNLIEKFIHQLQARNDSNFKCLFYKEVTFEHGK
jgi:hypothetical protein